MAVCYTVVYSPDEANSWVSFEEREDLGLKADKPYRLHAQGEGEQKKFYVINERKEKIYNIWEKARGDFIE